MTWNLTLDILLVLLILLFAPIGYMRGPSKEILVSLGVTFGALLAPYWARPWGQDLDYYFDMGDDPGAFVVAMAILMSATFIGGYGLGLLYTSWDHSPPARVLGALISAFNGALLVGFSLQYVRLFLLSDANEESLEASHVVNFLVNEIGWLLLGGAIVVIPVLVFGLATGRRVYSYRRYEDEDMYDDYLDYDLTVDDYEDEPYDEAPAAFSVVGRDRQSPARSDATAETRVLPPRTPGQPAEQQRPTYKSDPDPGDVDREAISLTRPLNVIEGSNPQAEEQAPAGDTDPEMTIYLPTSEMDDDEPEELEPEPTDDLPEGYRRCQNCQAVLPPGTTVCSVCGEEQA